MRMRARSVRAAVAVAAAVGATVAAAAGGGTPDIAGAQGQAPTFRSGVEVISIDTTVVDRDGRPIPGLGADRFEVLVDGRPRRVISAQFVDLAGVPAIPAREPAPPRPFSTNDTDDVRATPPPDRLIVLAVDHASFRPGSGRSTLEAARRFIQRLDASDRVALVAFPEPGLYVPPTTDHGAVASAIGRIAGTAERLDPPHLEINLGLTEAIEIAAGDRQTFDRVTARECLQGGSAADVDQCRTLIELDAPVIAAQLRARTARSLNGLTGLLENLGAMAGRKTLILVSAGLAASADRPAMDILAELRSASEKAARAETVIHALHVEAGLLEAFGADRRRVPVSPRADADLMAAGLEAVVDLNGGALFKVTAGADAALDRVAREISAYYVLGIEPEANDRDGRPHAIRVRLAQPGAVVRHRRQFTIARPSAAAASPDEALATVLRSGQTVRDLPIRVSTHVMRDIASEHVRVLVRADIGRDVTAPAHLRVGLAVFDASGQPSGSTTGVKPYEPTPGPGAAWPFQEIVTLRPGQYTLRLAVRDADGRVGSVVHAFDATLRAGSGARVSDILVADGTRAPGGPPAASVDGRVRGPRLSLFVEVYPDRPGGVSGVSFDLVDANSGAPLMSVPASLNERTQERRILARADLDVGRLAPGSYTITATAHGHGATAGRASRHVIVGSLSMAARAVEVDGRRFQVADVLSREAVEPFLARLREADSRLAPRVASAAAAAAAGDFERVLAELADAGTASVSAVFLRGLALLAGGDVDAAAAQLRAAVALSNGFAPAAFYLGACDAARGRDAQAVEAWQTALLLDGDVRIVYEALADAWLRQDDGERALAVLARALAKWPGDERFIRRQAAARALAPR